MAQKILDYWTTERLLAATAEPLVYDEHNEETAWLDIVGPDGVKAAGSLKIVPDSKVITYPYESVGKLFYKKVGPSGSRDSFASAWVANLPTKLHVVGTAAHVLKSGNEHAENILFVPSYIPPDSKPSGSYPQIPGGEGTAWFVDPNWKPEKPECQYDQAVVALGPDPKTGKYVDDVVVPLEIVADQEYTKASEFNTIGYPQPSSGNPHGKMCERNGTFEVLKYNSVYKAGSLPGGTSGGPWILAKTKDSVNGIQAGNRDGRAISPYFGKKPQALAKYFKLPE